MNKKLQLFLIFALITFSHILFAQDVDQYGNINIKGLSEQDMQRIFGDVLKQGKIFKTNGDPREIKEVIINGNKITTIVFNYGSIDQPGRLPNVADLVWQGLGYGFEFGPLAAAEVTTTFPDGRTDTLQIVDDSFVLPSQGSYSPDRTLKWGWLPKPGFSDPNSTQIATLNAPDKDGDGKPDSWPERWFSPGAGKYLWPAFLGDQATAPDEEVFFVMDDYTNEEFPYYPFPSDSSKRGLGLDNSVRILQYNNPLAEDIIFIVYQITNASEKPLNRVYFGMHGDPHVGGATDFSDDRAFFIPALGGLADPFPQRARNMVYAWDDDGKGFAGRKTGYFGWKFLESPTNSVDAKDNDDDGLSDESPFNSHGNFIDGVNIPLNFGIADLAKYTKVYGAPKPRWEGDEDGDWDLQKDDIGIDGIGPNSPNYPGPDFGEGDAKPSQAWYLDVNKDLKYEVGEPLSEERLPGYLWAGSEPNFGMRDVSESDQLGLVSFHAAQFTNSLPNVPKNTTLMWEWLSSETIDPNQELLSKPGDNIFNFGTGPLGLELQETQRFSMSILFGDNLNDLVLNAETAQRILESDYRFAKPPDKPIVKVVPGDNKVTLFWDNGSESSFDPFTRANDFQGYKIYRSQDFSFSDVFTITDGNGVPFLGQALFDPNTGKRAQFDLVDSLSGFHPVEYIGRAIKYFLGNNTGLVHEYVDSTVKNGITYYYAVVAYDGGSIQFGIPPSETQAVIKKDPITNQLQFDVNTAQVIPGSLASGIQDAEAGLGGKPERIVGNSTGKILLKVLDNLAVKNKIYKIDFVTDKTYNVLDSTGVEVNIISKDTVFVALPHQNILLNSFKLFDSGNNLIDTSKYIVNGVAGRIRGNGIGSLPKGEHFKAQYRYYPVYKSSRINGEDGNNSFDGVRVYVFNDSLTINNETSGFSNPKINILNTIKFPPLAGNPKVKVRADWEIRWKGLDTTATGQWTNPGDTAITELGSIKVICPFSIWNVTENKPGKFLIFVPSGTKNLSRWKFGQPIILRPQDATGATTTYEVDFTLPSEAPVFPQDGDIYFVNTKKPFRSGDEYIFNTKTIQFEKTSAQAALNDIYVVPNPYVAFSESELPGLSVIQRGERNLQFRNLPPKCTIRIYTLVGELVETIEKDDNTNMATWDLLSNEGQRIAYGVYIYHVDAPGIGEKIGRIAIIK